MYCSSCNAQLEPGGKYCQSCGSHLTTIEPNVGGVFIRTATMQERTIAWIWDYFYNFLYVIGIFIGVALLMGIAGAINPVFDIAARFGDSFWNVLTILVVCIGVYPLLYLIVAESRWGTTRGKANVDLEIVNEELGSPSFLQVAVRNVAKLFFFLFIGNLLDFIAASLPDANGVSNRTLHDRISGTYVVSRKKNGEQAVASHHKAASALGSNTRNLPNHLARNSGLPMLKYALLVAFLLLSILGFGWYLYNNHTQSQARQTCADSLKDEVGYDNYSQKYENCLHGKGF